MIIDQKIIEKKLDNPYITNNEDISLITNFLKGDRISFDRLVLKYQDRIFSLCVYITGNRVDGEDAAQETFVKVFKSLKSFKGDAQFSTWLYRIAVNTCKNYRSSWWSRLQRGSISLNSAPGDSDDDNGRVYEISDTRFSPEKDMENKRLYSCVKQALASLPQKHSELIVLRDMQGLSYEEIEKITGLNSGTVKSRLARAREAMQEQLRGKINGYK